jgi:hypothetical protein
MVRAEGWDRSGLDVIVETCEHLRLSGIDLLPYKHVRVWHVIRAANKIASNPRLLKALPHKRRILVPEWEIDYTLTRGDMIASFWEAYRRKSLR